MTVARDYYTGKITQIAVLFAVVSVLTLGMISSACAVTISYVGEDTSDVGMWRSTSVSHQYAPNGEYYGSSGYLFYAVQLNAPVEPNGAGWMDTDPLTFDQVVDYGDHSVRYQTIQSLPGYISVANNGQSTVAFGTSWYPEVDDPTVAPGPTVRQMGIGLSAIRNVYNPNEYSMLDITIGAGFPAGGLRIGVWGDGASNINQQQIRLQQTGGAGGGDASMNPSNTVRNYLAVFDLTDANEGDKITLKFIPSATGNNFSTDYRGLSFDVLGVPEPSVFSLLVTGGVALAGYGILRRRRRTGC